MKYFLKNLYIASKFMFPKVEAQDYSLESQIGENIKTKETHTSLKIHLVFSVEKHWYFQAGWTNTEVSDKGIQ